MENTLKLVSNATYGDLFDSDLAAAYQRAEVSSASLIATVEKIRYHLSKGIDSPILNSEVSEFIDRYEIPARVKAVLKETPIDGPYWDEVGVALRLVNLVNEGS